MEDTLKKPTILLIEDDVFMIELFAKAAAEAGFQVVNIKTGKEAVERIEEIDPDLTVLDVLLPDMNGFEILRRIRRTSGGPIRKVFIMSNVSEARDMDEARRLGALEYLIKTNITLPEVMEKIQKVLGYFE